MKKRFIGLFTIVCLLGLLLTGCVEPQDGKISVALRNEGEIVCTASGAELQLNIEVTGASDRAVIFIIDETENYVSVDEDTHVMTVGAGVPNRYAFTLTVVAAADRSRFAAQRFTVTRSDLPSEPEPDDGLPVYLPDGRIKAPSHSLVDDFSGGLDSEKWYISTQTWGGLADYQGCRTENVSYTRDGILLLKAQGKYSTDVPLSGAAVITRQPYGAGSYTVAMKVMPRLGACNAMWTYYYGRGGRDNHEIDIELPGHVTPGGGQIGYDRVLNTNWVSETDSASRGIVTASPANDGKWHTYRFDWHTSPQPRIDYYVDGVLTSSATEKVPSIKGLFWLGVWLPKNWCGQPDFEVDYMMVDWFSFRPFDQPTVDSAPQPAAFETNPARYPQAPVSMPVTDYISNGGFEGVGSAWQTEGAANIVSSGAYAGKHCLSLAAGAAAGQTVTAVYGNFKYDFSAYAGTTGRGRVEITFRNRSGDVIPDGTRTFEVASPAYSKIGGQITAPAGSDTMTVRILSDSGTLLADNVSVRLVA